MLVSIQVNKSTEIAMSSNYNLQSGNVLIAVGGKYTLDDGAVLKVRCAYSVCTCNIKITTSHRPKLTIMDKLV